MTYLFDTHLLLWSISEPEKLSGKARGIVAHGSNDLLFSAASIWEVAIKYAKHPRTFNVNPMTLRTGLLELGYSELPLNGAHAIATASLPFVHRDPFDRMLIAQAMVENLTLLTVDTRLLGYRARVELIG